MTTIKQQLLLDGQLISNKDPEMVISLDPVTGVQLDEDNLTADTIAYRFVENVTVETNHEVNLTFIYQRKYKLVVPLTLTQVRAELPIVVPKALPVKIFQEGTELPFSVTYNNQPVLESDIVDVVITPNANVEVTGNQWWVVDAPVIGGIVTAEYAFNVKVGEKLYPMTHTGQFEVASWNGKYFWMEDQTNPIFATKLSASQFTVNPVWRGKPVAHRVKPTVSTPPANTVVTWGASTASSDNVTLTTKFNPLLTYNGDLTITYVLDSTASPVENKTKVTVRDVKYIAQESGSALEHFVEGNIANTVTGYTWDVLRPAKKAWLAKGGKQIPWTDTRIRGEVIEGSTGQAYHTVQSRIDHFDEEGPMIEITGTNFGVANSNYLTYWLDGESGPKTAVKDLWVYITKSQLAVTSKGPIIGHYGEIVEVETESKWNGNVISNELVTFTAPSGSGIEFVSATATHVKWKVIQINDTTTDKETTPMLIVSRVGADGTGFIQRIVVKPTPYDITVTDAPKAVSMWDKGTTAPFTVYCNNRKANVTPALLTVVPNGVVKATATPGQWSIESDTDIEAHDVIVEFTYKLPLDAVLEEGPRSASGTFKVAAYNGEEFVLYNRDAPDGVVFMTGYPTQANYYIMGKYRGEQALLTPISWDSTDKTRMTSEAQSGNGKDTLLYWAKLNTDATNFGAILTNVIGVSGKSEIRATIQTYAGVHNNTDVIYPIGIVPATVTGKYLEEVDVSVTMGYKASVADLTAHTLTLSGTGAAYVELVPEGTIRRGIRLRFKDNITADTAELEIDLNVQYPGIAARKGVAKFKIKQLTAFLPLELSEGFPIVSSGDYDNPLTLTQTVIKPE